MRLSWTTKTEEFPIFGLESSVRREFRQIVLLNADLAPMNHWHRVASVADLPPGSSRECLAGDRIVAIFNVEGTVFALDGVCPHQGGPLGKGELTGGIVTCPWHGWQFDVRSGQHQLSPSICQPRLPARIEGDDILVALE